jgi:pyruvate dehydrogenase E2 component (dihydrolipoamide acetyltransferase)
MATKVHMEALSPTMEEGQVVKWLKAEGDSVSKGDVLAEIETDKATMELSARGKGVLRKILVQEGGTAPVGDVIAVIAAPDEDVSDLVEGAGAGATPSETGVGEDDSESSARESGVAEEPPAEEKAVKESPSEKAASDEGGRVRASPLARRLAQEAGLELGEIDGSGPDGRVIKRDVEAALERDVGRAEAASGQEFRDVPLSQMRKTIARRLTESLSPVPHFFLTVDVDMTRVVEARRRLNALLEDEGVKVSVNDIVLRAAAAALRKHPECNASWQGDAIRVYEVVHLGVAVAVEDGLITPVVRNAHAKGLIQIGAEVREMAGRAREKKLKPDEYTGATFSVSNLGMFGIEEFTAIINPPEAGILAVGRLEDRPVAVDGEVIVMPRMRMTMSCDHRVIDGATGARFLQTLQVMLEEPTAILL